MKPKIILLDFFVVATVVVPYLGQAVLNFGHFWFSMDCHWAVAHLHTNPDHGCFLSQTIYFKLQYKKMS